MRTPDNTNADVVVVGGGIGGLSAAFALSRLGLKVRVLERAKEFGEVGAGLQLAPNCTRILDDYGLLDEAKARGVVPDRMVMRDAVDGDELTALDLRDLEREYGFPYMVIHRSDLHALFLDACRSAGVELLTEQRVVAYAQDGGKATATTESGTVHEGDIVIAADGLHSVARKLFVDDEPVSSAYVAYRGTVPIAEVDRPIDLSEVVVYVGPRCHFVHYGLRGGALLNQVAVFRSPKASAGQEDWGTPDELDAAFAQTCEFVRQGLPHMWRDKWWRMFDRDPIDTWVQGRIALLGDAAHGYCAMQHAVALLGPVERREVTVRTAFPGPGGRDAIEMVLRAVTGDRFVVTPELAATERGATLARYVWEFTYRDRTVLLRLRDAGFVTDEFIALGARADRTPAEEEHLTVLKQEMTTGCSPGRSVRSTKRCPDPRAPPARPR